MAEIDILVSEVGPRDGLQSIDSIMSPDDKKKWIKAESEAGVREIEVGSFVRPDFCHRWQTRQKLSNTQKAYQTLLLRLSA
ncbi:MAG: hypothetical protein Ct9H300mP6_00840 [Gammaproteobacteria bacterium]|nr:MAG: hypothetical protein Ct9H300mP6_00840 [Gammaproteobacteria bacterium]